MSAPAPCLPIGWRPTAVKTASRRAGPWAARGVDTPHPPPPPPITPQEPGRIGQRGYELCTSAAVFRQERPSQGLGLGGSSRQQRRVPVLPRVRKAATAERSLPKKSSSSGTHTHRQMLALRRRLTRNRRRSAGNRELGRRCVGAPHHRRDMRWLTGRRRGSGPLVPHRALGMPRRKSNTTDLTPRHMGSQGPSARATSSHGVPGPLCTCDLVTWGPRAPLHVRPRHMGSQGPSARATSSHGVPGPLCTCDLVTWGPRAPLQVRPRHMGSQGPSARATSSHGVPGPLCTCDLSGEVAGAAGVLAAGPIPQGPRGP